MKYNFLLKDNKLLLFLYYIKALYIKENDFRYYIMIRNYHPIMWMIIFFFIVKSLLFLIFETMKFFMKNFIELVKNNYALEYDLFYINKKNKSV